MKNIKGFAVASDGNMKRIAVTYDEYDDAGKIINANVKINRIVTDATIAEAIDQIETYLNGLIE